MIPIEKVKLIVDTYKSLEQELASGDVDKKNFVKKSKEYSSIGEVINEARAYISFEKEKKDLEKIIDEKEGDKEKTLLHAKTTDQLILFATNGRFYSISVSSLPSGRSHGEPIALMCDLAANDSVVSALVFNPDRKLVIASDAGRGFIVPEKEVLADAGTAEIPSRGSHVPRGDRSGDQRGGDQGDGRIAPGGVPGADPARVQGRGRVRGAAGGLP